MLTATKRNELNRATNAKAIRAAIFQVGFCGAALFAANEASRVWPGYETVPLYAAIIVCVSLGLDYYRDWRSISFLEERLDRDEDGDAST